MATKDHTLDAKIIASSKREFLHHGFHKASLHTICKNANITTGALYTRYKNKDALFASLVQEVFDAIQPNMQQINDLYIQAHKEKDETLILAAIRKEQEIYQELLFEHYDACVLLYARSAGSEVEKQLKIAMDQKAASTIAYFRSLTDKDIDLDGIALLLNAQFYFYSEILEKGYSKQKALSCLKLVSLYQEAGWKAVFEQLLS